MEEKIVHQNVTPVDFDSLKADLATEGFSVVASGVDSFTAMLAHGLIKVKAEYNRNQQTLVAYYHHSGWLPNFMDHVKEKLMKLTGKEEASDKIQEKPLTTPVDSKTNIPLVTKKEDKTPSPNPPVATNVTPVPTPVASVPTPVDLNKSEDASKTVTPPAVNTSSATSKDVTPTPAASQK